MTPVAGLLEFRPPFDVKELFQERQGEAIRGSPFDCKYDGEDLAAGIL